MTRRLEWMSTADEGQNWSTIIAVCLVMSAAICFSGTATIVMAETEAQG
jgi:hypothetical protein